MTDNHKKELIKSFTELIENNNIVDYSIGVEREAVDVTGPSPFSGKTQRFIPGRTTVDIQVIYNKEKRR